AQRSRGPGRAFPCPGRSQGRRRRRSHALRRRLHPRPGSGLASHRRPRRRHRPPGDAGDRFGLYPRRPAVPLHAPRAGRLSANGWRRGLAAAGTGRQYVGKGQARTTGISMGNDALNIVIVDDQTSARTMLRHILEDIGPELDVRDFGDPLEALEWCSHNRPDLMLLDYRMPGLDGLEFARRFRIPLAHRDVPIVLVTVVGDEPIRQAALDAGVIDFL